MKSVTLEQAREAFEKKPNRQTALLYLQVAIFLWERDELDADAYNAILELCRSYNAILSI